MPPSVGGWARAGGDQSREQRPGVPATASWSAVVGAVSLAPTPAARSAKVTGRHAPLGLRPPDDTPEAPPPAWQATPVAAHGEGQERGWWCPAPAPREASAPGAVPPPRC